ncbi:MAG: septum formation family protein [Acidimicrobiales bacterium]
MSDWGSWGGAAGPGGEPPPPTQPWGQAPPPTGPPPYQTQPYDPQPYQPQHYGQPPGWGPQGPPPTTGQSKGPLIAVLVALGVLLAGGGAYVLVSSGDDDDDEQSATTLPPGTDTTVAPTTTAAEVTTTEAGGEVDIFSLGLGDCWNEPPEETVVESATMVPCDAPHDLEIYAVYDVSFPAFPGEDEISTTAENDCVTRFADFIGIDYFDSALDVITLYPTEESWASGDREVACSVYDPGGQVTGSLQDAAR